MRPSYAAVHQKERAPPMCPDAHDHDAGSAPVRCAVLTVSDTRTRATDRSGPCAVEGLEAAGHTVAGRAIVTDEPEAIAAQLEQWLADPSIRAVITTGGTGLGVRDRTVDVVRPMLTVEMPGFGELFRMLSYEQVGSAAMLSIAAAGLAVRPPGMGAETFVFCLPGSPKAVTLAVQKLIGPQLGHLVALRAPSPGP